MWLLAARLLYGFIMSNIHHGESGVFDGCLVPGNRPALLVVDVMRAYTDPHSPFFSKAFVTALDPILAVTEYIRRHGHPIISTRVEYQGPNCMDGGLFVEKVPALKNLRPGSQWSQYADSGLAPQPSGQSSEQHEQIEIVKQFPSAFFETSLARTLTLLGCDTVFIIGYSTSGCIRASVIDALQHGFRPFVISECVADRSPEAHKVNLFDIQSKYGEVVSMQQAKRIYEAMHVRSVQ